LNDFRQFFLLYWGKRWVIQKRDIRGLFFLVVVPVILVALVLLILTVDMSSAGPAIELSPTLYHTSSTGGYGLTDVVVGSLRTEDGRDTISEFTKWKEVAASSSTFFQYQEEISSSEIMSKHLLETYNLKTHNTRFGAFVLQDRIPLEISVDWSELVDDLRSMDNSTLGNLVEAFNLFSETSNSRLQVTLPATQIAGLFPEYGGLLDLVGLQGDDPVTLSASHLSWDPFSNSIVFTGTNAESGEIMLFENATISIPFDTAIGAFPQNDTVRYVSTLPSYVSSLHNASSPHAV